MPRRHPAMPVSELSRVRRVERCFEAIRVRFGQFSLVYTVIERGQHDLGRKRQRRHYGPRGDGSVVGAGAIACGNSPAMAAIALELEWVVDRVLLLHMSCTAAVLEIVDAFIAHE